MNAIYVPIFVYNVIKEHVLLVTMVSASWILKIIRLFVRYVDQIARNAPGSVIILYVFTVLIRFMCLIIPVLNAQKNAKYVDSKDANNASSDFIS